MVVVEKHENSIDSVIKNVLVANLTPFVSVEEEQEGLGGLF